MNVHDPFHEFARPAFRQRLALLGASFEFTGNDRRLRALLDRAYRGLPRHRLSGGMPAIRLHLQLSRAPGAGWTEPPRLHTQAGAGLLCGIMDRANFAAVSPDSRAGVVCCSRELLRFPYHARYELLEFAVFTLASRAQGLAPLHAACVGLQRGGILLIGDSGAGKSTLALQCMQQGLEVLAEDAVFVAPQTLLATGVANFLHVRESSLRFLEPRAAARIRRMPVIRRRSGTEKFAIDLRTRGWRIARQALQIAGIVFVSKGSAATAMLRPLGRREMLAKLIASQPYAAQLPSWGPLVSNLTRIGAFELHRGGHPRQAAAALGSLLAWGQSR